MSAARYRIGIGFGRMKIWHDGLGEFSRQLGLQLAQQAPRLREAHGIELCFHLAEAWHGMFGDAVTYLPLHLHHRWLHVRHPRFDVWHTLTQHNRFQPPLGTRHRLMTVHDLNFLYGYPAAQRDRDLERLRQLVNRQNRVVAISRHVRSDIQTHLPAAGEVAVIYNGASDLTMQAREALANLSEDGFLLHISRMAETKNVGSLLDLAEAMPHERLVLAGPRNRDVDEIRGRASARGLNNVVVLTDISEKQKAWLYANCRGFLFPSLTEGFGLPPLEAMHFGKPVFLSRLTSLPEVGGNVAYYFDNFDAQHMRTVVTAGLADVARPGRREALMAHAQRFSWARCAADYLKLYCTLLGMPHAGTA